MKTNIVILMITLTLVACRKDSDIKIIPTPATKKLMQIDMECYVNGAFNQRSYHKRSSKSDSFQLDYYYTYYAPDTVSFNFTPKTITPIDDASIQEIRITARNQFVENIKYHWKYDYYLGILVDYIGTRKFIRNSSNQLSEIYSKNNGDLVFGKIFNDGNHIYQLDANKYFIKSYPYDTSLNYHYETKDISFEIEYGEVPIGLNQNVLSIANINDFILDRFTYQASLSNATSNLLLHIPLFLNQYRYYALDDTKLVKQIKQNFPSYPATIDFEYTIVDGLITKIIAHNNSPNIPVVGEFNYTFTYE